MDTELKQLFLSFFSKLQVKGSQYSSDFPEVLKFWQDGFTKYISKMKEPKNINQNSRRYFHLHALQFLLKKCNPSIIWNLCPGNLRTIFPVIQKFIDQIESNRNIRYWINIDVVPEIIEFNNKMLKGKWPDAQIINENGFQFIKINNLFIINLLGTVEDFFSIYSQFKESFSHFAQTLFCLDGIANVCISPYQWISWWNKFKYSLSDNLKGWYFTWLNASTLDTKFEFYYNVAFIKHKHPLNWVVATQVQFNRDNSNNVQEKFQEIGSKNLTIDYFKQISLNNKEIEPNYIFRFYKSKDLSQLVFQAFYLHENGLKDLSLINNNNIKQFIGHREVETLLFDISTEKYDGKETNFVKSIPYLGYRVN